MTGKTFYLSHWYNIPYIKSLKVVLTRQDKTNILLKSHLSYYKTIIYIHIIYKTTKSHS